MGYGKWVWRTIGLGIVALALLACRQPAISATGGTSGIAASGAIGDAWSLLNTPGTVVLMRHALAPGTGDPPTFRLNDCATQRNLNAEGRDQARQLGAEFRRRRIVVRRVLSSQWCRCLETAKLLNLGTVEPVPALNSFFSDRSREPEQTAAVRRLIVEHRQHPGVVVMVTHQVNITALTGIVPSSGASVVVRATAAGEVDTITELPP